MTTEALVRPDAEAPARGSPAARPRSARGVSKRVFARLDQAGIPGTADTLAPQRLVAFFGDLAPRELSDKQRERYRAMVGACGLPAAQADADLALLTPSTPLGAPLPDSAWAAGPHDPRAAAAIPVAPAPGAIRFSHIDAIAEILGPDAAGWQGHLVPDDQVDLIPEPAENVEVDAETRTFLVAAGQRMMRIDAARKLGAAGDATATKLERTARKRDRESKSARGPVRDAAGWQQHLAERGLATGRDELTVYKRQIRGTTGHDISVVAAVVALLGPAPSAIALKKEFWRYRSDKARALRLSLFFKTFTADQISDDAVSEYCGAVSEMTYGADTKDPKCYSFTTIQNDVIWLRRALRGFQRDCQLAWAPAFKVPNGRVVRKLFLTRRQVARLLWATRGRVHDPVTDDWLVHDVPVKKLLKKLSEEQRKKWKWVWDGEPYTKGEPYTPRDGHWEELKESFPGETVRIRKIDVYAKRHRKGLARAILVAVYAGLRHEAIMRLGWEPHPTRGWVDVEAGLIHRFGFETKDTSKTAHPVSLIAPPLLAHLRRWHKYRKPPPKVTLRRGRKKPPPMVEAIVLQASGHAYASAHQITAFANIVEAAGLDAHLVMHSLRHTAATWHCIMGTDCRQAARLLGMSVETMDRIYTHWHPSSGETAAAIWLDAAARRRLKAVKTVHDGRGDRPRNDHARPQQRPRRQASPRLKNLRDKRAA